MTTRPRCESYWAKTRERGPSGYPRLAALFAGTDSKPDGSPDWCRHGPLPSAVGRIESRAVSGGAAASAVAIFRRVLGAIGLPESAECTVGALSPAACDSSAWPQARRASSIRSRSGASATLTTASRGDRGGPTETLGPPILA